MLSALLVVLLAGAGTIFQIAFLSHFGFPWSTLSFALLAVAYGAVRDRPLLALGWALVSGALLDLHGLLGFGSEIVALFAAFFAARYLFERVLTNTGAAALFLLGAVTAVAHWFALAAIDGISALFGAVPLTIDLSLATVAAPFRQALVNGAALLLLCFFEEALRRRFRKTFLSHASATITFS